MKPQPGVIPRALCSILCLSLLLRLPAPSAGGPAPPAPIPRALVKRIVVGDGKETEADAGRARLTRAGGTATLPLSTDLALYAGDTIETFADTRVTVLFLDPPVNERDNEVIINADSKISISSTYSWWGAVWVKVKGTFESRTRYARLGAQGTEYEVRVVKGEERPTVIVLEGSVEAEEGTFTARGSAGHDAPAEVDHGRSPGPATSASYAPERPAQEQYGRVLGVQAGQVTNYDYTFNIANQCGRAHSFTFQTSGNTDWLRIVVLGAGSVRPRRTEPVRATVTIDATRLSPGNYRGRIFSHCVECDREPQCNQAQLEWPIQLTVGGPTLTPTMTPTPTPTGQGPLVVRELEEVTLTAGVDSPVPAPTPDVLAVLAWTNNVILNSQPTYPAPNLLPHFATPSQRSQSFRDARQSAVLEQSRGSNKTLGDVYSDWGEGAQAANAYVKASGARQRGPVPDGLRVDLSEAYRLTGRLARAQVELDEIPNADQAGARYFNASGNLSLERARVALDKNDAAQAREQLTQARADYQAVSQGAQPPARGGDAVIQSNLGETHLLGGALALRERNAADARAEFDTSARLLGSAQQSGRQYPFAVTNLGQAFQGFGNAAQLEGNEAEARANYAKAEDQYRQALGLHPDMAEAYFNLGDLFEDQGRREEAKQNYGRAIRLRPEQSAPYYPLAVLLQDEDPRRAAELAATFLQLLPEEFKQGERARNAERIRRGEKVPSTTRTGTPPDGGRGVVTTSGVPDVVGKTWDAAVKSLGVAGFTAGRVEAGRKPKSSDLVVEQRPAAGGAAPRGSAVNLLLEQPVEVPGVKGDKMETAKRKISKKGLTVGQITFEETCDKLGKVLAQNPRDGEKVARGGAVDLTIGSVGDNPVTLPDWVGRDRPSVEAEIKNAGLRVGRVRTVEVEGAVAGTVVRQEPAAGAQLAGGCKVKLQIAAEMVSVGNYVGKADSEAARELSNIGLHALNMNRADQGPPGRVLGQSEPEGKRVRKGSFVILYVSAPPQPPPPVQLPSLIERPVAEAKAILKNLGLDANVIEEYNSDYEPGEVWYQSPGANQKVLVGSTVTIKVSTKPPPVIK
jgi:beta-lactam-binding protein with PASTA domain/tetratricopeptide (TPR) repeat protein